MATRMGTGVGKGNAGRECGKDAARAALAEVFYGDEVLTDAFVCAERSERI
jgi:hypothetical protein